MKTSMAKIVKLFFVFILLLTVSTACASKYETKDSDEEPDTTEKETENKDDIVKLGGQLDVGDVSYTVNAITTTDTVGNEYLNTKAQGIYLIVDLSVTNNSDKALTVSDSFFKVINDSKTYEADSTASIYIASDDDSDALWFKDINPDITLTGKVVFDVSQAVIDSNTKELQVQTGFWGTQTGTILLVE